MEYYMATVVWYDENLHEAALLVDGRESTTMVFGVSGLIPGQTVVLYADGTVYVPHAVTAAV